MLIVQVTAAQEVLVLQAQAVDYLLALEVDCQRVLAEAYQLVRVADYLPGPVEAYQLDLGVDCQLDLAEAYQLDRVVAYLPGLVVVYQLAQVEGFLTLLEIIGVKFLSNKLIK